MRYLGHFNNEELREICIITGLNTGGSLRQYMKRLKHPRFKVVKLWIFKVLKVLDYLHAHGIVHGRLTCQAVYINNGDLKLGDLGIRSDSGEELLFTIKQLEFKDLLAEKVRSQKLNDKFDVYCLGILFLEILII